MLFKKITATFNAINRNNDPVEIKVERVVSGANAYGDRSAHIVYVNGDYYQSFDTRYDGIKTDKKGWLKEVIEYIIPGWLNTTVKDYKEEMVEI